MPHLIPARESAYYPRRARGPHWPRRMIHGLRAAMKLERLRLPAWPSLRNTLAAVVIPGLAFHLSGPRLVARIIWMALPFLVLVFLAGLGTFVAEVAFGLMIAAHVTSVSHLLRPLLTRSRLVLQLVFGVVLFVAASVLVYVPAREWFHRHVAMPITVRDQIVIINPRADAATVGRGDVVVYRISAASSRNVIVREGVGAEAVLGMPGDRLVFGPGRVYVNGSAHLLPASSPEWEALVVPDHCWYIWPGLHGVYRGGVPAQAVEAMLQGLALVDRSDFVGRPHRWWFFRAQGSA
jgi:hypothetical protein